MKRKTNLTMSVLVVIWCFVSSVVSAQTTITTNNQSTTDNQNYDPRLLNDYTADQLDEIKAQDPEFLKALEYYYTQSYLIEIIDCFECITVDPANFNVGKFEHLRKKDDYRIFVNEKGGFKLTLTPINKMDYKLPIHLAKIEYNIGE